MYIRFRFKRGEELKFIGHLDILRLFERAFKRSGLPVAHSQGFNPRPQIVFAQPMPLGLTSSGEFADVELIGEYKTDEFIERLNGSLPPGLQLIEAKERINKSNLMSIIESARYNIGFTIGSQEKPVMDRFAEAVMGKDKINVTKKTKSGEKEINIRQLIYELTANINGNTGEFKVLLGAGQNDNVRPDLFLAGVSDVTGVRLELKYMHRLMLYVRDQGEKGVNNAEANRNVWISPLDDKVL